MDVLNALMEIPYGEIRTYKEIAVSLQKPNAARAVGGACNKNPLPIIIPCHRVIGSNKSLTGFAGGLRIKKFLLELENNTDR
jgi:methylated-DNA-[protein]-cysteine S-methyltransferase